MKVAILGAAHQHVDYALAEVEHREELELVAVAEADETLRRRFPLAAVEQVDRRDDRLYRRGAGQALRLF